MKIKKILSVALTAVLIGSSSVLPVCAKTNAPDNTYSYVALGDSISSGYGLAGGNVLEGNDPALILTQKLIDNPVKEAYPALFGDYLKELGAEKGLEVNATNLSATAYRAMDVEAAIRQEGYIGSVASMLYGKSSNSLLANYHNIFNQYLPDADLVSIMLGGNDIMMGMLVPMSESDNPVLSALSISMALTLFGCDMETAIGGGLLQLQNNKDKLDYKALKDAADFLSSIVKDQEDYVDNAVNQVHGVIDAVRSVNSGTDIALISMFNPYGTSLECDGKVYNFANVMTSIFTRAAEEICGCNIEENEPEPVDDNDIDDAAQETTEDLKLLSILAEKMDNIKNYTKKVADNIKKQTIELVKIVADEVSYPMQYFLAGKPTDPVMLSLNGKLANVAEETGCAFVDIYDISNEDNLDPHPNKNGHKEIAEMLKTDLFDLVNAGMDADLTETPAAPLENTSTVSNETPAVGEAVRVTASAEGGEGKKTFEIYFKRDVNQKWNKIGKGGATATFTPTAEAVYNVKVIAKDEKGTSAQKIINVTAAEKKLTNTSVLRAESIALGNSFRIDGFAENGTPEYTFEFYFKRSTNTKWNKISYGDESGTYAKFTPTAATSYDIKVVAIDSTGAKDSKIMTITAS